jgi:hypothetical protein
MDYREKTVVRERHGTRRRICPSANSFTLNPTRSDLGSNLEVRCGKLATGRLRLSNLLYH